jgi:hypothetical protein
MILNNSVIYLFIYLFIYFKVPEPMLVYGTVHYKTVDINIYIKYMGPTIHVAVEAKS